MGQSTDLWSWRTILLESELSTEGQDLDHYTLVLYVAGQTARSLAALANLKKLCEEHLHGRYTIEVVDVQKNPQLAKEHQILALPTLVRKVPSPMKKLIGDLSNIEKALVGMDIKVRGS